MGKPQIAFVRPLSLLTAKALRIYQYQWKFLGLAGLQSHPLRHLVLPKLVILRNPCKPRRRCSPEFGYTHPPAEGLCRGSKIGGVPVRIYSAAKTVADCLKYRREIGSDLAARILRESIAGKKRSEQRLRHFANICRVGKLVHAAYF